MGLIAEWVQILGLRRAIALQYARRLRLWDAFGTHTPSHFCRVSRASIGNHRNRHERLYHEIAPPSVSTDKKANEGRVKRKPSVLRDTMIHDVIFTFRRA